MFKKRSHLLSTIRSLAAVMTAAKLGAWITGILEFDLFGDDGLIQIASELILSTPVFAIAAMITGQWIGEIVDAYYYRIEGGVGGASKRHLIRRLRFTKHVLNKPWWYPNDDRIKRELDRTNRALIAAGLSPIDAILDEDDPEARTAQDDYIRASLALLNALGVRKAARLSPAVKRRSQKVSAPWAAGDGKLNPDGQ